MISESDLNKQLGKIIKHDLFCRSKRSISFLEYICTCKIQGRENYIKEFSIGVDAFGLSYSFNPQDDPRVRVEAQRLRKKLEKYYENEGTSDSIIIKIPKGSYIPIFNSSKQNSNEKSETSDFKICKTFYFSMDELILKIQNDRFFKNSDYCINDFILDSFSKFLYKQSENLFISQSTHANEIFYLNLNHSENLNEIILEISIKNNGEDFILKKNIVKTQKQDFIHNLENTIEDWISELINHCKSKVRSNISYE